MAAAILEDVQLIRESSWIVSQGSLESCLSVVFLDPASGEPAIPSSPNGGNVVLVPPAEPVPCEVTIKFQGRLCNIQSFYILSTARTYELYSQSEPMQDPEYICTVRGWTPERGDVLSSNGKSFLEMNSASYLANSVPEDHRNEGIVDGVINCVSTKVESEVPSFDNIEECIPTVDSLRKTDPTVINYSISSENDDLERSVYSSGEDSWVEVKLNGSLSCECPFERPTAPQSIHGQLDEKQQGADSTDMHSPKPSSRTMLVTSCLHDSEMNCDNFLSKEPGVSTCPVEKFQSMPTVKECVAQQNMYEAELELVDHSPWASLTIRLLSLQDRSHVVIDQIVFLAVIGPPVPISASLNQSGSGGSSSLLAMLMPSMLQMVRGVPNQRLRHASLTSVSNGNMSLNSLENMIGGYQPFESTTTIKDGAFVRKDENQVAQESCIQTDENVMVHMEPIEEGKQGLLAPSHGMKKEINVDTDVTCVPSINIIPSAGETRMLNSEKLSEQPLQPIPEELFAHDTGLLSPSFGHDNGSNKNLSNFSSVFSALERFSDRFDKLEALCMRMEAYLITTVERLDQRLTLLEMEHSKAFIQAPFSGSPSFSVSPQSPGLGGKATVSAAWIGPTTHDDSEIQGLDVKEPLMGSYDAKGGCVGSDYEVTKTEDSEDPASTEALGSRSSTMAAVSNCPEKKPQVSLDDAWASALSAFSSSAIPSEKSVSTPFVAVDSEFALEFSELKVGSLSFDPSCDVPASRPCADSDCTLTKGTQDLSRENSTIVVSGFEKLVTTSPLTQCEIVHASSELQKDSSILSEETDLESRYCDDVLDKNNNVESLCCDNHGKENHSCKDEKPSLCNETDIVIDLQRHTAGWVATPCKNKPENSFFLGHSAIFDLLSCSEPFENTTVSEEKPHPCVMLDLLSCSAPFEHVEPNTTVSEEKLNPCTIFDLLSCSEPFEHVEKNTAVSGVETLVLFHKKSQDVFVDFSDPKPLDGYSPFSSAFIDVSCTKNNAPWCDADLGIILGEDIANKQDDTACSDNSVCNAQEFDTSSDDVSVCEWTSAQSLFPDSY